MQIKLGAHARTYAFLGVAEKKNMFALVMVPDVEISRQALFCVIFDFWMPEKRSEQFQVRFFLYKAAKCMRCADGQHLGASALPWERGRARFVGGAVLERRARF